MFERGLILLVIQLLCLLTIIRAQSCTLTGPCSCNLDDGGVVDLSSLGNMDNTPRFADYPATDGYSYSFNPCYGFTEGSCLNAAGCQVTSDQTAQYLIGDASTAAFTHDGTNVHLGYTAPADGGAVRVLDVTLVCDPSAEQPSFISQGEQPPGSLQYAYTLTTKCACSNGCGGPGPNPTTTPNPNPPGPNHEPSKDDGGISTGTIICIVAIGLAVAYAAGGIAYMATVRNARGAEVIPNAELWKSLPGLIKDGFKFTIGKCFNRKGYSNI